MPSVLYVLEDKLGGVLTLNGNLVRFRERDGFSHDVLKLHNRSSNDARWSSAIGGDHEQTFEYTSLVENLYSVLRRLRSELPGDGEGVLVANDWVELALATEYDLGRAVIQIVHADYNLELAIRHEPVIDAFVVLSREHEQRLKEALPHRMETIHHIPYGVPIPKKVRRAHSGPLRLLFIGRMTSCKGIFDLPAIDRALLDSGARFAWTVVGEGPEKDELRRRWSSESPVHYFSTENHEELLSLACRHDVFVLPSYFEGLPVSLLETMASGLVPVVSNLRGGIQDVVHRGITGFRVEAGDAAGFASVILELDRDRDRLDAIGAAARTLVQEQFDIRERVKIYQALFARWRELRRERPTDLTLPYGSRLDKRWMPNALVRLYRSGSRRLRASIVGIYTHFSVPYN